MDRERGAARELAKARAALERGKTRAALRHAWDATHLSARADDEAGLRAVIEVATAIRDRAEGRVREEAELVIRYCSHSADEVHAGVRRPGPLSWIFRRESEQAVKACPDCAETVKAAAKVCRFCGYRFDA